MGRVTVWTFAVVADLVLSFGATSVNRPQFFSNYFTSTKVEEVKAGIVRDNCLKYSWRLAIMHNLDILDFEQRLTKKSSSELGFDGLDLCRKSLSLRICIHILRGQVNGC